jgi:hypothetical protein
MAEPHCSGALQRFFFYFLVIKKTINAGGRGVLPLDAGKEDSKSRLIF